MGPGTVILVITLRNVIDPLSKTQRYSCYFFSEYAIDVSAVPV
jgi:hypothetical protein